MCYKRPPLDRTFFRKTRGNEGADFESKKLKAKMSNMELVEIWGKMETVKTELVGIWGKMETVKTELVGIWGKMEPVKTELAGIWGAKIRSKIGSKIGSKK